jgi:predicted TIM-barrel fold metal-dependent hydrolase
MTTTDHRTADAADRRVTFPVIDTDVHEYFDGFKALVPYLAPGWHSRITEWGFSRVDVGFPYTSGMVKRTYESRDDWRPADGGELGSDLDVMRRNLFEEGGVSIAVLSNLQAQVSFMKGEHEFGTALASAYNDQLIEHWLDKEPRLAGGMCINIHDPEHAVREIDRVGSHPQIAQVALPTIVEQQLGDPRYRPVWDAIVRNGLVLGLHHGYGTRTAFHYPRQHIEWKALAPSHGMMSQLASLIFNGVFDEFPDFKVIAIEAGFTWLPYFMSRLDAQYVSLRDQVPWVKKTPSAHLRGSVRFTTQPMEPTTKRQLTDLIDAVDGSSMLMFSSDYPHYDSDEMDEALPAGIPEDLLARIMGGNALDTYPKLRGMLSRIPA